MHPHHPPYPPPPLNLPRLIGIPLILAKVLAPLFPRLVAPRSLRHALCCVCCSVCRYGYSCSINEFSSHLQVAYEPEIDRVVELGYAERGGFRVEHPDWCRVIKPVTDFEPEMERLNRQLSKEGHTGLIFEEMLGGRLYTGPMYHKYNHVLRAKSGNTFIADMSRKMCKGNLSLLEHHERLAQQLAALQDKFSAHVDLL